MNLTFRTSNNGDFIVAGHGADLMDALLTPAMAKSIVHTAERVLVRAETDLAGFDAAVETGAPAMLADTPLERIANRIWLDLHTPGQRTMIAARVERCRVGLAQARADLARVEGRKYVTVGDAALMRQGKE